MVATYARTAAIFAGAAIAGCGAGMAPLDPLLPIKPLLADVSVDIGASQQDGLAASVPFPVNGRLRFNDGQTPNLGPLMVQVVTNQGGTELIQDSAIATVDSHDDAVLTFHASIRAPARPGPCRLKLIHMAEVLTTLDLSVRSR
ncbi:MAG TPA: hypothetical protein VND64_25460 [Pirellulales bacterium]|nr:hypothetical protein [Pirellulales bacterium]